MKRFVAFRRFGWVLKESVRTFISINGPFLASGLAFDLLLNFIPLLFLIVSTLGYALSSPKAVGMVQTFLEQRLPPGLQSAIILNLAVVASKRNQIGLIGFILYIFFTITTFGSIRMVLNTLFNTHPRRGFLGGKAVDFFVMLLASGLFIVSATLSALVAVVRTMKGLPISSRILEPGWTMLSDLLGLLFTATLLYILYRFCPGRRISRKALWTSAGVGTLLLELSKTVFPWYISIARSYAVLYGTLSGFVFLLLWIYYASLVFIFSAVIGSTADRA